AGAALDCAERATVADRDDVAEALGARAWSAICLDRARVDEALADARWLRRRRNRLPVIALVDTADVARASELFACGVQEIVVRDASSDASLRTRIAGLVAAPPPAPLRPLGSAAGIVAKSPAMRACLELVRKAQRSDATVLLLGETGTGKEVLARTVHEGGRRAGGPFVAINCAAFPETLLESELFGHDRGAFTGANRARAGHFVQANRGTLFLDEIGETTLGFQVKLLRALQEGKVRPLGAGREQPVDARIIAATNRELEGEVEAGRFRRDLFFRLNVFPISLPPLRARSEDVVPLVLHFLERSRELTSLRGVAADARHLLETYPWPGNVRELENEVARIVTHAESGPEVTARMLSPRLRGGSPELPRAAASETLRQAVARFESWYLKQALERNQDRRIATARQLGITRECLYKKLRRYGMQ
ncbi:MAG TPA: sigma 54-interacting transcriptional regulator, partial [Myxococcota bacterium]|nr:sigma 54-interacting transcriptional regulator [Myxococcota bacterium]